MTNEKSELLKEEEPQSSYSKSHEHFNPVVVTDTVGTFFLGAISIILMIAVGGLLIYIRKLEDRFQKSGRCGVVR
jgi:hypothetical protein